VVAEAVVLVAVATQQQQQEVLAGCRIPGVVGEEGGLAATGVLLTKHGRKLRETERWGAEKW